MPTFELSGPDGAKYQLDAPDENSALSAFRQATGAAPGAPAAPKPEDTEVSAGNVVRSAARGVPILGGLADKANAVTNAALAPLVDPLLPDQGYEKLPEASFGDRYKHALDIQNRKDAGFDTAHPVISTGAKIAGGMAAFGGALKAAPQLAAPLGFEGTLPQMVTRGATSGALISGADAATRGEDAGKGAAVGAVTGAAAPLVGLAIGKGVQAVKGAVRGKPPLVPESTVDVAGVTVPLPNRAPAAADQVEIARRGGFGESARDVVAKGDAAAQEALDTAKGNIATSLDPGGAVPPQNAAERVASELRAAEANRFATQQAAAGRAAGDVAVARQAVAGGAPAVAGPEAAAEGISADLRALEGQRAASEAATRDNVVAETNRLITSMGPAANRGGVNRETLLEMSRGAQPGESAVLPQVPRGGDAGIPGGQSLDAGAARQVPGAQLRRDLPAPGQVDPSSLPLRQPGQPNASSELSGAPSGGVDVPAMPSGAPQGGSPAGGVGAVSAPPSPFDAAGGLQASLIGRAEEATAARNAAYKTKAAIPGEYDRAALSRSGQAIRQRLSEGPIDERVRVTSATPKAQEALDLIDETIGGRPPVSMPNEAQPYAIDPRTGMPQMGPRPAEPLTGQTVEEVRKALNTLYGDAMRTARMPGGNATDARAMKRIIGAFDDHVSAVEDAGGFSGDAAALRAARDQARGLHSAYKNTFEAKSPKDEVGKVVEKIIGRHEGQEFGPDKVLTAAYGPANEPGGSLPAAVAQRIRDIFSADSPEWAQHRQGLMNYLVRNPDGSARPAAEAADRIETFLSAPKGRVLSQVTLSPEERAAWASHAQALRASQPVPLSALDDTDRLIARISGRDGSTRPSPAEVADLLYGRMGTDRGQSIGLVQRLKQTFGADSRQFSDIKQGMVQRVIDGKPGEVLSPAQQADRLESFMSSSMAKVMLNDGERGHLETAARSLRAAEPAGLKDLGTVDKVLARITGRDGSPPASLNDVTDYFFGPSSGKRSLQFQLATRLKRELSGEGLNALRVGMWSKLTGVTEGKTDLTTKRLSDNIFDFINGPGSDLAKAMYSAAERAEMLKFAEAVKAHIPMPGSTNPSGTAPMLAKMANKAGHAILPTIGFAHGGLPGALLGVGADKALSSVKNAAAANRVGLLYYGKQPKVPDDPRLAIAAAVFARSLPQGQSAGNR